MAERNDNGDTERLAREVKGLLGVKTQDDDAADVRPMTEGVGPSPGWTERNITAPLNSLVDGERKAAVRDQVRLMARALGLTVSESDAAAHAADLLALVAAEKVSGVGNRAVAAHLLTASARRHEETQGRIAAALEALARGKGHDEPAQPAQPVSGAPATYSAQQIADLRVVAGKVANAKSYTPAAAWEHGTACVEVSVDLLKVYLRASTLGGQGHRFLRVLPGGLRHADFVAWIAATCRAIATYAEGSPLTLDRLVALELEGTRCTP